MINNVTSSTSLENIENRTKPIRNFVKKLVNDWSFDFASMIAYNFLITLLPITVIFFAILGFIFKNNFQIQQDFKDKLINSFPSENTTHTAIKQVKIFFSINK